MLCCAVGISWSAPRLTCGKRISLSAEGPVFVPWSSHSCDLKCLCCQMPGTMGSFSGPVGPESIFCDRVRQ